jgi:CDP-paratose 2-epimerase
MEDQGWVAWFMIASQLGRPITVYGDGCQVRDVLFIDDLLDAYDQAFEAGPRVYGKAYNIGGGPGNVLSVLDVVNYLEHRTGRPVPFGFDAWRPGDQKIFVSNVDRAKRECGWEPKTSTKAGLDLLFDWIQDHLYLFEPLTQPVTAERANAVFA